MKPFAAEYAATFAETVDWAAFCKWWEGRVSHHQTVGQPSEYWVIEGAARADELEDQRVELGVMEISDLRQRVAEVGAGDEAQLVIDEVVLAIEKREIITWCQKAEDHMSTKTNDAAPKKKAVNQTKALRCYEAAEALLPPRAAAAVAQFRRRRSRPRQPGRPARRSTRRPDVYIRNSANSTTRRGRILVELSVPKFGFPEFDHDLTTI